MCKNLMIAGIKPGKDKELFEFMKTMAPIMNEHDDDGLGYAAMTDEGLYIERWVDPKDGFAIRKTWNKKDQEVKDEFQGVLRGGPSYNFFEQKAGCHKKPVFAVIMHARAATCEVTLANVHPFYREGIALIHNGVITNHEKLEKKYSTCDSEVILNSYYNHQVKKDIVNIDKVAKDLSGGFACGVLTKDESGKPILDLFRNSPALSACHIKEIDAVVFTTMSYMVRQACVKLKWSHGTFFSMEDNNAVRIDARTGKFMTKHKFPDKWATDYSSYHNNHGNYGNGGHKTTEPTELGVNADQANIELARAYAEEKKKPKLRELESMRKHGVRSMIELNTYQNNDFFNSKLKH